MNDAFHAMRRNHALDQVFIRGIADEQRNALGQECGGIHYPGLHLVALVQGGVPEVRLVGLGARLPIEGVSPRVPLVPRAPRGFQNLEKM